MAKLALKQSVKAHGPLVPMSGKEYRIYIEFHYSSLCILRPPMQPSLVQLGSILYSEFGVKSDWIMIK